MEIGIRNLLSYSVELVKILIVTAGIMGYKLKIKRRGICALLSGITLILIVARFKLLNSISLMSGIVAACVSAFILDGKNRLICSVLAYLSISMIDVTAAAMTMFISQTEIRELYASAAYVIAVNSLSPTFLALIAIIRFRMRKPRFYHIAHMKIAYISTSLISQVFFLLYLTPALILGFDGYSKPLTALSLSFSGVFFIISNVLVVEFAFSKRRFKSLYYSARNQSDNLTDYFSERLIKAREKQKTYHDMPYHLLSVQSLLNDGDTDEAQKYVDMLTERLIKCRLSVNTGNHQLNAIISGCTAKYPNAKIEISGIMPDALNIPCHDFCIILSNLLDNAFRMADMLSGVVKIEMKLNEDTLYIHIVNTVRKKVKIIENTIHSTKYGQGIGILNVSEYVEKNGGKVFYCCSDKCFTADLYLTV